MTVRRKKEKVFAGNRTELSQSIRKILGRNSSYQNSVEKVKDSVFKTYVKPNFLMLGTDMFITLRDTDKGTIVTIETQSQMLIQGDIFDYYNRYIDDFFREMERELHQPSIVSKDNNSAFVQNNPNNSQNFKIHFLPQLERVEINTEKIDVPNGVNVKVKRSRTIEHTIDVNWSVVGSMNIDIGLKQIISASIYGQLEQSKGQTFQQSETLEYEVALNGDKSNRYKLTWVDLWKKGTVEFQNGSSTVMIPFQIRELTELKVVPEKDNVEN
jgi:tyrosine-protein phosphatase YwqE